MACWACDLAKGFEEQHLTTWYYVGPEGAVVTDRDAKGWAKRLLFVPARHVACGGETEKMRLTAVKLLSAVGRAVTANEGLKPVQYDMDKHTYASHWHAQLCFRRKTP